MNDLRLALRRLFRAPGFFASAVLTLSLGMGANAFVYSAVNGLLVRPIPLIDADRVVWIFARAAETGSLEPLSGEEGEALQAGAVFDVVTVIGDRGLVREVGVRHDRWRGIAVSRGIFDVLGVAPVLGEPVPLAGPPRIAISYERWQKEFGGDPAMVGRELAFADNKRFVVAAILPSGLEFPFARAPHRGNGAGFVPGVQDFWILESGDASGGGPAIARLRPGDTLAQAQARVSVAANQERRDAASALRRLEVAVRDGARTTVDARRRSVGTRGGCSARHVTSSLARGLGGSGRTAQERVGPNQRGTRALYARHSSPCVSARNGSSARITLKWNTTAIVTA